MLGFVSLAGLVSLAAPAPHSGASGSAAGRTKPTLPVLTALAVLAWSAPGARQAVVGNTSLALRYNATAQRATVGFHAAFWSPKYGEYGGDAGAVQSLTTPGEPPSAGRPLAPRRRP